MTLLTFTAFYIYSFAIIYMLNSRDFISILIALELTFLAISLLCLSSSMLLDDLIGITLSLYLLPLAGADAAIALALIVAYYPNRGSITL